MVAKNEKLVDFYEFDRQKRDGSCLGNTNNMYSSACANYLTLEPNQLQFKPDTGVNTAFLFTTNILGSDEISVSTLESYLSTNITKRYPLFKISSNLVVTGQLSMDIFLFNNQFFTINDATELGNG